MVRDRDDNLCVACRQLDNRFNYQSLSVHHIAKLVDRWDLRAEPTNCITLCNEHHRLAEDGAIPSEILREWIDEK